MFDQLSEIKGSFPHLGHTEGSAGQGSSDDIPKTECRVSSVALLGLRDSDVTTLLSHLIDLPFIGNMDP